MALYDLHSCQKKRWQELLIINLILLFDKGVGHFVQRLKLLLRLHPRDIRLIVFRMDHIL